MNAPCSGRRLRGSGVVVLFAQIGALRPKNKLHDKHLEVRNFFALRNFRADWCASTSLRRHMRRGAWADAGNTSSLRSRNSSLNCQPSSRDHAAKFVPGDLATIDDDHGQTMLLVGVAIDGAAEAHSIVHVRPVARVVQMGECQSPAHLADTPAAMKSRKRSFDDNQHLTASRLGRVAGPQRLELSLPTHRSRRRFSRRPTAVP